MTYGTIHILQVLPADDGEGTVLAEPVRGNRLLNLFEQGVGAGLGKCHSVMGNDAGPWS
jgi:hypothetical protein